MEQRFLSLALLMICLCACGSPAGSRTTPAASGLEPAEAPTSTTIPSPAVSPTPVPNILYIDPTTDLGPISPYVYGSNYGPFTAVPAEKMQEALDSKVTALRFPGGEWGDQNEIQTYHLDMFMDLCRKMGALPTISVRLLNGTPEAVAELVRYANIEKGYAIRYWSIGNEPDLYARRPNTTYDTQRFNQEWRVIAAAMRAVDPGILLMGPELSGSYTSNFDQNPKDSSGRDWMTEFLRANGDMVNIVTYHRYPFPVNQNNATIDDLRKDPPEWSKTVPYLRALVHETTGRDLPVAVTEASSDSSQIAFGAATPDSFYNAIWWADVLGRLINENVFMVNQWVFAKTARSQGGWGLVTPLGVIPTYYDYQMYSHFGTERVYAASGVADVSIYAAKRSDGALTAMVINLTDSEQRVPLRVGGAPVSMADTWLFDAQHNAEHLGKQAFPSDGRLVLPAQSITVYIIEK
jgi:hypothetical protein